MLAEWQPSPFGEFIDFYKDVEPKTWLWQAIEVCSRYGCFHADAHACILARPVFSGYPVELLNVFADLDPENGLTASHDAWHIIYAAGDTAKFFYLLTPDLPQLPKLIWQRDARPEKKVYDFEKMKKAFLHRHGIKAKDTERADT